MKLKLSIIIVFLSITTFGQLTGKVKGLNISNPAAITDTAIKVVYNYKKVSKNHPAVFFNGKLVSYTLLSTLNSESIASINVIKKDTIIDSVKYYGQLIIQGKTTDNHNYISLNEFKLKYISPSENVTVFQIDGNIIDEEYDSYWIDEMYILKVIVSSIDNSKQKIKLDLVNLLTKSVKNIENSNQIILR
ncbi:hypothetical protein [uncultured Flavobacterium sp.]|uniref:hypothetical protein n=1 Tax=uncultured Flavobacterium sp. TaxID=165435 RepID=UPI0030CA36C7